MDAKAAPASASHAYAARTPHSTPAVPRQADHGTRASAEGEKLNENKKQAASIRIGSSDILNVKQVAECPEGRDPDVILGFATTD